MTLHYELFKNSYSTDVYKVTGFTEDELNELKQMDWRDMKKTVLEVLDKECNGIGTCWHNGYGVFQMWIAGDAVMVEIGKSCD